ncbi:amidohydrolase family protein [Paraburkholderia nemoris]|uniref:metal-dependent hydrolase family protein n=1 Tax=Paraburkholderia nemoris TaxID=2793076 RepID=UPI0038BA803D
MKPIVFTDAILFDGETYFPHTRYSVRVERQRIVDVFDGTVEVGNDIDVVHLDGALLMPGLIDAHTHANIPTLNIAGLSNWPVSLVSQHARHFLEGMLQRGFTTVRDAGGADIGLVQAIEAGLIDGPRFYIAGRALSQTGGHGDLRGRTVFPTCSCNHVGFVSEVVDGVDEIRKAVREQFRQGVSQVKIMVSGGVLSPTDPIWMNQFSDDEISVAVEEASRWRAYVMAHAHTAEAALRCARLGVRSIEHGTMIDRETAARIADTDAFVVPTLSAIESIRRDRHAIPAELFDKLQVVSDTAYAAIEHCHAAGVKIGLGSDLLGLSQGGESEELILRSGLMPTLDILRSATRINGELVHRDSDLGVIRAGALADLIVLDKNPFVNLDVFGDVARNVTFVMKDGRVYKDTRNRMPAPQSV